MKRILHVFWLALALTAALMLLAPQTLAAEGTATAADYITIAADGTVTLHSTHMAAEAIASVQLTLNGAGSFSVSEDIAASRLTHVRPGDGSVTVYIAGSEALMTGDSLVLGTVEPAEGVKLAKGSLKYVYGSSAVALNFEDEQQQAGGGEMTQEEAWEALSACVESAETFASEKDRYTAESWDAFQAALRYAKTVLSKPAPEAGEMADAMEKLAAARDALALVSAQEPEVERGGSGGTIYDGYDDGTGSGAPEPTQTPEATEAPSPEPTASAAPAETPAPTEAPAATSEPMTTNAPAPTAAPAQTPVPQTSGTGPQAPATGDETAFVPWVLTLGLCGALLAAVLVWAKRRQ